MLTISFFSHMAIHGRELREKPLGGTATSVIMLAEAFARLGHDVTVYCPCLLQRSRFENVTYAPVNDLFKTESDLLIVNNSANDLWGTHSRTAIVWQHNKTSLTKAFKRGEIFALFFKRPILVVLSDDAYDKTPKFLPYRRLQVIPHAIEDIFLSPLSTTASREKIAFFASRASRNLDWVITAWKAYVYPRLPDARFEVCTPPGSVFPYDPADLKKYNIFYHGSLKKAELLL